MQTNADDDLIEQALARFRTETGLDARIMAGEPRPYAHDALIHVAGHQLAVEIKHHLPTNLGMLIARMHEPAQSTLLCTDYINPVQAEKLKAAHVPFMDAAGNAYLNLPACYVFIKGNRPLTPMKGLKAEINRAFEPAGLKVIFAFLTNPALVTAPYRDIAQQAGVALGTVGWIINGLKDAGFLMDMRGRAARELINRQRLIDRWAEAYVERLRPKLLVGFFQADQLQWWHRVYLGDVWIGGELAAERMTGMLRPEQTIIYVPEQAERDLILAARLRRIEALPAHGVGLTTLYRPFWAHDHPLHGHAGCVHPILVYADLLATGDPRNIEAARLVYDTLIH